MATKAIKGVSDDKWAEFKSIAANRDVSMGELFSEAVDALAKEKSKSQLEKLMDYMETHTSRLTDEDVERMRKFRKNFRMRRLSEIYP